MRNSYGVDCCAGFAAYRLRATVGVDTFTMRWEGKVEPLYTQTYTFYTVTDDGVRLWVNGWLVIDKWQDRGPTE